MLRIKAVALPETLRFLLRRPTYALRELPWFSLREKPTPVLDSIILYLVGVVFRFRIVFSLNNIYWKLLTGLLTACGKLMERNFLIDQVSPKPPNPIKKKPKKSPKWIHKVLKLSLFKPSIKTTKETKINSFLNDH